MHHGRPIQSYQASEYPMDLPKGNARTGVLRTGNPNSNFTMQADLKVPATHTVQFHVVSNPLSNNPIRTEAIVTWFVGGNSVIRRISVGDGTSISGTGNSVQVQVFDRTVDAGGGVPNGVDYTVSCQVAVGTRPTVEQPAVLIPIPGIYNVSPFTPVDVPVPDDTGIISVQVTAHSFPPVAATIPEAIVTHISNALPTKVYNPTVYTGWVPLAPGSTIVQLNNLFPLGGATIIYTVTFGIDG